MDRYEKEVLALLICLAIACAVAGTILWMVAGN